jgi:hypothetical protein
MVNAREREKRGGKTTPGIVDIAVGAFPNAKPLAVDGDVA